MTLTEYMSPPDDWNELDDSERINVLASYVVDLEQEVDRLQSKVEQVDRDIDIIDRGR